MKPSHDQIARRARQLWEKGGCQQGKDQEYWLQAEAELTKSLQAETKAAAPSAPAPTMSAASPSPMIRFKSRATDSENRKLRPSAA